MALTLTLALSHDGRGDEDLAGRAYRAGRGVFLIKERGTGGPLEGVLGGGDGLEVVAAV